MTRPRIKLRECRPSDPHLSGRELQAAIQSIRKMQATAPEVIA